jgi:hypothetical protein
MKHGRRPFKRTEMTKEELHALHHSRGRVLGRSLRDIERSTIAREQAAKAHAVHRPAPPQTRTQPASHTLINELTRLPSGPASRPAPLALRPSLQARGTHAEWPDAFMRAGVTDWINNAAIGVYTPHDEDPHTPRPYDGLGAVNPAFEQGVSDLDTYLAANMPAGVKAAIDAAPLPLMMKVQLKRHPTLVFMVAAEAAQLKFIDFIRRVQPFPKTYTMGGKKIVVDPQKKNSPAFLAAQFLTVCNRHPAKAAQVAVQMTYELGIEAPLAMATAAVQAELEQAAKTGEQIAKTGQQTAEQLTRMFTTFKPFGAAGGDDAGYAAATFAAIKESLKVGGTLLGLVTAAVALANVLVPGLLQVDQGKTPTKPPPAAFNAAAADAQTKVPQAEGAIPPEAAAKIKSAVSKQDKILGIPRNVVVYGGGALALAAVGYGAWWALKKRKKR